MKDSIDFDESTISPEVEELMKNDVASVEIEYDKTYGFPTLISIDYIKDAIDDEVTYMYSDFEITN